MIRRTILTAALLVAGMLLAPLGAVQDFGVVAIRAGRLLDTDAGTSATNQIILVSGGNITAVGTGVTIPPGARVIDLSQATVLPGLFDVHTHLCMTVKPDRDHGNYFFTTLSDP